MRAGCTIVVGFLILAAAAADEQRGKEDKDPKGKEKVELTGTLRTGIVAIGGETTGTLIETKKGKFELDFGKKKELRQIHKGVEIKQRKIVSVTSLEEAKEK
jgi:hypothetical protein